MKTLWQTSLTAACAALLTVLIAAPSVAQPKPVADGGAREKARAVIAETIEKRVVRPLAPARIEAEAERITASLPEDQIQALAETGDAAPVLAATSGKAAAAKALGSAESDLVFVPLPDHRHPSGQRRPPGCQ